MATAPSTQKSEIYVSGVRQITVRLSMPEGRLAQLLSHLESLKGSNGTGEIVIKYHTDGKIIDGSSSCEVTFSESHEGVFYELLQNWAKEQGLAYDGLTAGDVYARTAILQNHHSLVNNLKLWEKYGYCPI